MSAKTRMEIEINAKRSRSETIQVGNIDDESSKKTKFSPIAVSKMG